jgi:predicted transposase/invertase (TIGR01784 family)
MSLPPKGLEKYQPSFEYLLIDEGRFKDSDLEEHRSLVSALFQLERQKTPEQVSSLIASLIQWLAAPERQSLRRAFTVWLGRVLLPGRYPNEKIPEFHDLQEVNAMLSETVKSWPAQWLEKGKKEGREEGREKGKAEVAACMLADGFSVEKVCKYTGLSDSAVKKIKADAGQHLQEPAKKYRKKPDK